MGRSFEVFPILSAAKQRSVVKRWHEASRRFSVFRRGKKPLDQRPRYWFRGGVVVFGLALESLEVGVIFLLTKVSRCFFLWLLHILSILNPRPHGKDWEVKQKEMKNDGIEASDMWFLGDGFLKRWQTFPYEKKLRRVKKMVISEEYLFKIVIFHFLIFSAAWAQISAGQKGECLSSWVDVQEKVRKQRRDGDLADLLHVGVPFRSFIQSRNNERSVELLMWVKTLGTLLGMVTSLVFLFTGLEKGFWPICWSSLLPADLAVLGASKRSSSGKTGNNHCNAILDRLLIWLFWIDDILSKGEAGWRLTASRFFQTNLKPLSFISTPALLHRSDCFLNVFFPALQPELPPPLVSLGFRTSWRSLTLRCFARHDRGICPLKWKAGRCSFVLLLLLFLHISPGFWCVEIFGPRLDDKETKKLQRF